jgi:hypothetical protein
VWCGPQKRKAVVGAARSGPLPRNVMSLAWQRMIDGGHGHPEMAAKWPSLLATHENGENVADGPVRPCRYERPTDAGNAEARNAASRQNGNPGLYLMEIICDRRDTHAGSRRKPTVQFGGLHQ